MQNFVFQQSALQTVRSATSGKILKVLFDSTNLRITIHLTAGSFNSRRLADIVNYIRQRPVDFPLWHSSDTAKLFAPPIFKNEKKARGYFFLAYSSRWATKSPMLHC